MKVIINSAMTVDGKISTSKGDSKISSREDLVKVHKLRASVDAIVVGISTILADDPLLTVRLVKGKEPCQGNSRQQRQDPPSLANYTHCVQG